MGATASKDDAPFETLDADQVRDVVAGFGTQFAGAADKMREAGIDGDYLAHASDDDLAVVFEECGLTKLQQSLLKQKLRKATAPAAVWKSTSASGAPDNSSQSHFFAMTRPTWLGRAARKRHRHAIILISTQVVNQKNVLWDHLSCRDLCGNQNFTARSC